jgi:hypothetical protein
LNFQHCNHTTTFPSHSFEQYYQQIRRFYRFGQKRQVNVDIITTEGETDVLKNMQRKAAQSERMFAALVDEMNSAIGIAKTTKFNKSMEIPAWL